MKKLVAVLGPGRCIAGDALYEDARHLGKLLATAGFAVVTGGYEGVMEAASKGASEVGGSAIGVTADVYFAKGREANEYITREVRVRSAADRLMELLDLPDAWIAIGNSTGTLTEVAMAWDYMTKGFLPSKPLLLIGEAWRPLVEYVENEEHFQPWLHLIEQVESDTEAVERLIQIMGPQERLPELNIL